MWVEKHRPTSLAMLVGNEEARLGFLRWLRSWKTGGKAALVVGSPGVGKTTTVHAAAKELSFSLIELNASDIRTKDKLERSLGPSVTNQSLIGKSLILLDEVDGIFGRYDFGGMEFVIELMENTSIPLVMTANAADDQKIKRISYKAEVFRFQRVPPRLVELFLRSILKKEGRELSKESLQNIVNKSKGDMRSAINDLQTTILGESASGLVERDRAVPVNQAFQHLFDAMNPAEALISLGQADLNPNDKVETVFSSLVTSSLDGESLSDALDALSQADEIIGRIQKTQEWRQLRYFDTILAIELFKAIQGHRVQFNDDPFPWELKLRLWNEAKYFAKVSRTVGRLLNVSKRQFAAAYLPYFALIMAKIENGDGILERMGVDESARKVIAKEGRKLLGAL